MTLRPPSGQGHLTYDPKDELRVEGALPIADGASVDAKVVAVA